MYGLVSFNIDSEKNHKSTISITFTVYKCLQNLVLGRQVESESKKTLVSDLWQTV